MAQFAPLCEKQHKPRGHQKQEPQNIKEAKASVKKVRAKKKREYGRHGPEQRQGFGRFNLFQRPKLEEHGRKKQNAGKNPDKNDITSSLAISERKQEKSKKPKNAKPERVRPSVNRTPPQKNFVKDRRASQYRLGRNGDCEPAYHDGRSTELSAIIFLYSSAEDRTFLSRVL